MELFGELQSYASPPGGEEGGPEEEEHPGRWTRKEAEQFFAREATRLLSEDPKPLQDKISTLLLYNPDFAEAVTTCAYYT